MKQNEFLTKIGKIFTIAIATSMIYGPTQIGTINQAQAAEKPEETINTLIIAKTKRKTSQPTHKIKTNTTQTRSLSQIVNQANPNSSKTRISYLAKGQPATDHDLARIVIHTNNATIKMTDIADHFRDADEIPDVIELNGKIVCTGNNCKQYKKKFVAVRDQLIDQHLKNIDEYVQKGKYILPKNEGKNYFIEDHSGFLTFYSPDKKFKYRFVDSDGDGTPEEIQIIEYQGNKSRLVLHAIRDKFTEKKFKGLMSKLYKGMCKHQKVKTDSEYNSNPKPKKNELDYELDKALDSLMR
ncbi:hypothetical protein HN587_00860 [Candidatus Woesearchaeota archaeon]|jgi:hypothetical protein|nr:hypothetical protein [Candidatus Woesearchaeota archaeon]